MARCLWEFGFHRHLAALCAEIADHLKYEISAAWVKRMQRGTVFVLVLPKHESKSCRDCLQLSEVVYRRQKATVHVSHLGALEPPARSDRRRSKTVGVKWSDDVTAAGFDQGGILAGEVPSGDPPPVAPFTKLCSPATADLFSVRQQI